MVLRRWTNGNGKNETSIEKYKIKRKGGVNMATVSFDREIILNDTSAEALIRKIEHDKKNATKITDINIEQKLEEGKKLLKQLFSL